MDDRQSGGDWTSPARDLPLSEPIRRAFGFTDDDACWFERLGNRIRAVALGRIGSFELIAEAGRGGQGLVYRARQERPAREVALKRLAAGLFATPAMRLRFEREIQTAASLDHPNIVRVYGVEEVDGQLVVAMQWIDGRPLDRWARPAGTAPRPISDLLDVFQVICDAIQHAHERGIIHRDLKPSNVLVDDAGEPHVLDFGLARRSDDSSDAVLTVSGAFVGTPAFASPEQLRTDNSRVTVRSDVYSLGAMLYVCLTGVTPVDSSLPPTEILRYLETVGPVSPSVRNPRVDRDLSAITLKAMHADPAQRYASVQDLAADVARYCRGEPIQARPPSAVYRARKFLWRNRIAVAVLSGFVLLMAAATTVSTVLYLHAEDQRARVNEALSKVQVEAATAFGTKTLLQDIFVAAGRSGSAQGGELTVRTLLDRAAERLDTGKHGIVPAEAAGMHTMIGDAYRELGLHASAERHFRAALALRREVYGTESLLTAQSMDALARALRALGRLSEAEPLVEEAWSIHKKVAGPRAAYLAPAANSVALVKRWLRKYDEAEKWYLEALARYVDLFGPESQNIPSVLSNLGAMYVTMGRLADAETQFRDAMVRARKIHGSTPHEDLARSISSLADVLSRRGDPEGNAESLFRESHGFAVAVYGARHFRVAQLLVRFSDFLSSVDRNDETVDMLRQAREILESTELWDEAMDAMIREAEVLRRSGQPHEALYSLRDYMQRVEPKLQQRHADLARGHLALGELYLATGDATSAADYARCAHAGLSDSPGASPADFERASALLKQAERR